MGTRLSYLAVKIKMADTSLVSRVKTTAGTRRNHSKKHSKNSKTTTSLPSYTTTTWKWLISRFVEDGNTRQQLSFSFSALCYSPLEFNSKKFANIWRTKREELSAIKFQAAQLHFLSDIFVTISSVRCCLSSMILGRGGAAKTSLTKRRLVLWTFSAIIPTRLLFQM